MGAFSTSWKVSLSDWVSRSTVWFAVGQPFWPYRAIEGHTGGPEGQHRGATLSVALSKTIRCRWSSIRQNQSSQQTSPNCATVLPCLDPRHMNSLHEGPVSIFLSMLRCNLFLFRPMLVDSSSRPRELWLHLAPYKRSRFLIFVFSI